MRRSLRRNILNIGCLPIGIGFGVLVVLTFKVSWWCSLGALALVLFFFWLTQGIVKEDEKELREKYEEAFAGFSGTKPRFGIGNSYGWPEYTLTFRTEDELKAAEAGGYIEKFKETLRQMHADLGTKKNRFNVDAALTVTYQAKAAIWH